jgi:GAF domain-containing protein
MTDEPKEQADRLDEALRTIDRSQAQSADNEFADRLRQALSISAAAGTIATKSSRSAALHAIVETAADVLDAKSASLFLLDEEKEELIFAVARGDKADEIRGLRIPMGDGIAGYVASTGQPIAVADAEEDPRFSREIAEDVGYMPRTILCVPLLLRDRIVGVLEVMDKENEAHFSTHDMETLGEFANLAAVTIEESKLTHDMRSLFRSLLSETMNQTVPAQATISFADNTADTPESAEVIRLAGLVHEISQHGDAARTLAIETLSSISRFLDSKSTR